MALAQQVTYARSENADPQLLALKVPPHSIEAEQSLLGALLLDNQAFDRVADLVTGEDFYRDDHRRLWRHIARLIEASKPADVGTVSGAGEAGGGKEKTGGAADPAAAWRRTRRARSTSAATPSWCASARCSGALRRSRPASPRRRSTRAARRSGRD